MSVRVNIPALHRKAQPRLEHPHLVTLTGDEVLALVEAVELGNELRLWEPGRRGWAAAFERFTDALAVFEFGDAPAPVSTTGEPG